MRLGSCITTIVVGAMLFAPAPRFVRAQDDPPLLQFPAQLQSIDGQTLDIDKLATEHNLVVITLKATWCPVCQTQLERVKQLLPELRACEVTFVVLAPGPAEELAQIRERTGFEFPFVADEELRIARSLNIAMTEDEILPCMFHVLPDRTIGWRQLGRNGRYFGDGELKDYFDCQLM